MYSQIAYFMLLTLAGKSVYSDSINSTVSRDRAGVDI
jgi:hypothetical protein